MWSGPRNLSTALMRSFSSRDDCLVWDEPFYAHYLHETGKEHPMRAEVLASQPCSSKAVVDDLHAPLPAGKTVAYQKQMAHHLLPSTERDWISDQEHAFLIRDPRGMLASLDMKLGSIRLEDTGLPQQVELFERLRGERGAPPPVIDSADLAADPRGILEALCSRVSIPFQDRMLEWPAGPHPRDGAWAPHWYANAWASTGFRSPKDPRPEPAQTLPDHLLGLADECMALYSSLAAHRIHPHAPELQREEP